MARVARDHRRFMLIDHLCRNCGGRMLTMTSGGGPTGGGNPIFICADCEQGSAAMGPEVQCWCGFHFKGQDHMQGQYQCVPFSILKEYPQLREAFMSCGTDPDSKRARIGVVLREQYRKALNATT